MLLSLTGMCCARCDSVPPPVVCVGFGERSGAIQEHNSVVVSCCRVQAAASGALVTTLQLPITGMLQQLLFAICVRVCSSAAGLAWDGSQAAAVDQL
jgi:hypothetical protein